MFYYSNNSYTPLTIYSNSNNSLPQAAVDFVAKSLKIPDFQPTLIDQIKDMEPEEQIVILNNSINELKDLLPFLNMKKLTFQGLLGVAIYLAKSILPPELLAFTTPFASAGILNPLDSYKEYVNNIISDFEERKDALEDEIEKREMAEERLKDAPTPLTYQFIDSLVVYLNSYKANRYMLEQRQNQLNNLNKQLAQAKTEEEKVKTAADIENVKARINMINSDIENLNDQVMVVYNETLSNHFLNRQSLARIGPQHYPWIFELNNKMIELEEAGYDLTDDAIRYLTPILNQFEDIVNDNYNTSIQSNVFEKRRWAKVIENLQPLFDIANE